MQNSESFFQHIAQTSPHPMALEISHAKGVFLYTTDGRRFVDFISGIAVSSLGHCHSKVVSAIKSQVQKHLHVMVYGEFIQESQSRFAALLASMLPEQLQRIYLVNSGTEANEGALKLAKKSTGRSKIIAFRNSYHGDTHGSLSVTGRDVYRDPFLPLLPDIHFFDFNSESVLLAIDSKTAAVILEPIQGEGGIIPADAVWLQKLRKECSKAGALLIFDEIQSGAFRTGHLFAFQEYGVVPDILCMAKAMGGGLPLGAFASSHAIFETFADNPPLNHVTTFGGNPVSCAAAAANLMELSKPVYARKAIYIEEAARKILNGNGIIEVRGKGAMLGLQLRDNTLTQQVVQTCFEEGILLGWTLHSDSLIRLAPPLIITKKLLEETLYTILRSVQKYA